MDARHRKQEGNGSPRREDDGGHNQDARGRRPRRDVRRERCAGSDVVEHDAAHDEQRLLRLVANSSGTEAAPVNIEDAVPGILSNVTICESFIMMAALFLVWMRLGCEEA